MIEISTYCSTSKKSFVDLATSFTTAIGERVMIKDNRLVFPPSFAKGNIEFYELDEGLSIVLIDCVFFKSIKIRMEMPEYGENYKILFNVSPGSLIIGLSDGRKVNMSKNLAEAVLYSSHSIRNDVFVDANQPLKAVQIIYNRNWGLRNLIHNKIPLGIKKLRQFANNEPMQFITKLDLRSNDLIKEMFSHNIKKNYLPYLLEGYAYELVALFFNNLVEEEVGEDYLISEDAMRVIRFKEQIAKNLYETLPTLEDAASICKMSRTKFFTMFKTLFQSNYGEFFLNLRMEKAKKLIDKGYSVKNAGYEVGYGNISYFIKVYKEYFGVTPGLHKNHGDNGVRY